MRLTPPTRNVFWISTVLSALGLVATFISIQYVSANAFWFVMVGYILLWLGNVWRGF